MFTIQSARVYICKRVPFRSAHCIVLICGGVSLALLRLAGNSPHHAITCYSSLTCLHDLQFYIHRVVLIVSFETWRVQGEHYNTQRFVDKSNDILLLQALRKSVNVLPPRNL